MPATYRRPHRNRRRARKAFLPLDSGLRGDHQAGRQEILERRVAHTLGTVVLPQRLQP